MMPQRKGAVPVKPTKPVAPVSRKNPVAPGLARKPVTPPGKAVMPRAYKKGGMVKKKGC